MIRFAEERTTTVRYVRIPGLVSGCSQIVLGTSSFTPERKRTVYELLDLYASYGGNTLDTSCIYGGGKSENVLAAWLRERQSREKFIIINKGCHHFVDSHGRHFPEQRRVSPAILCSDLLGSLERMDLDYFDIYLIHRDDPTIPVAELIDALEEHKHAGRIKTYGVSNWSTERIDEANAYAKSRGFAGIVVNSPSLSLAQVNEPRWVGCVYADRPYTEWHKKTQLTLFSWASQASGFFTGRYASDSITNSEIARVYYSEKNWERFRRAQTLAVQKGSEVTANHIALAYVLHQPFPTCAVIGPQTTGELQDSIQATNIIMSEQEKLWLEQIE